MASSSVRRAATHADSDAMDGSDKGFKPIGAGAGSAAGSVSAGAGAGAGSEVVTLSQSLLSLPDAALERASGRSPTTASDSEGISTKGGEDGEDVVARMAAACRTLLEVSDTCHTCENADERPRAWA
jgi:hypothetical protein